MPPKNRSEEKLGEINDLITYINKNETIKTVTEESVVADLKRAYSNYFAKFDILSGEKVEKYRELDEEHKMFLQKVKGENRYSKHSMGSVLSSIFDEFCTKKSEPWTDRSKTNIPLGKLKFIYYRVKKWLREIVCANATIRSEYITLGAAKEKLWATVLLNKLTKQVTPYTKKPIWNFTPKEREALAAGKNELQKAFPKASTGTKRNRGGHRAGPSTRRT